ncbi:MAG: type II toxin-antitoxin system RelE/ParE family toxin [Gemmatimonadaceae bacterium]
MAERRRFWLGSSLKDIRSFPATARQRARFELGELQQERLPSDWKPVTTVGSGVYEIRIRTGVERRVLYVAKFAEGIYVLHVFEKKTQRMRKHDLDVATTRLSELIRERRQLQKGKPGRRPE